ncbi:hypothetical protein CDL12_24800 [Handroanthus impetiginosus]|uniref:Uncharacterized protein n=1 Tax=Handroanthus impetiginosus TaxID=429701 RepID=A0A2G9GBW7_9LAMI|nr:hypothetical protein CDL12_24800 [Handroanthus impetiginosus]
MCFITFFFLLKLSSFAFKERLPFFCYRKNSLFLKHKASDRLFKILIFFSISSFFATLSTRKFDPKTFYLFIKFLHLSLKDQR